MFQRVLKQMRDKVRARQYVMTLHAEEEMSDAELTIFDVERGILTGEIVERQKDTKTGEWKYLIKGQKGSRRRDCRRNQDESHGQVGYHHGVSSVTGKGSIYGL